MQLRDIRQWIAIGKASVPVLIAIGTILLTLLMLIIALVRWALARARRTIDASDPGAAANQRGHQAMERKDFRAAVEAYGEAISQSPKVVDYYLDRAGAWTALEDYEQAAQDMSEAILLEPDEPKHKLRRANCWFAAKRFKQALADYDDLLDREPNSADLLNRRANAKWQLGDHAGTIPDYDAALELEPRNARFLFNRMYAKRETGDLAGALTDANGLVKLAPSVADHWIQRGLLQNMIGRPAQAVSDFDQAIELDPRDASAWNNRGISKFTLQRYPEAICDYDQAMVLTPGEAHLHSNRGYARRESGDLDGAARRLQQGAATPARLRSRLERPGHTQLLLGQFDVARRNADRALVLGYSMALHTRSTIHFTLGDFDAGFADLRQHHQLHPQDIRTINLIAWLRATLPAPEARNSAEALQFAKLAGELSHWRDPGVLDTVAAVCADAGRFDQAIAYQHQALQLFQDTPPKEYVDRLPLYQAGQVYREQPAWLRTNMQ